MKLETSEPKITGFSCTVASPSNNKTLMEIWNQFKLDATIYLETMFSDPLFMELPRCVCGILWLVLLFANNL